ncbi:hypothetical protein GCM10023194_58740 [Planotetraspora phitsanulokensis]|uniref:DUF2637 domain-containing protein n=1 Tax=Planotetraspora phitsanulokensis TaxID=575192 RepID=A0A8J3UKB7_9ACTN|nr:hypothetical protein [Planotetraspora phitsanulokensis]GII40335.1 hypothetical protein Pph01_53380 [Planotetraspora phitsanulokensis]
MNTTNPPPDPPARAPARWPLLLLALPAGVATWSGWVGLGEKTGFGMVTPLPGIADGFQINTAITLPIGVETYAAYALGAWLSHTRTVSPGTRAFAKWSAIGALVLGMLGQVAYHLLEVFNQEHAPVAVTTLVSCLPVLVLGMGAALGHLLSRDAHTTPESAPTAAESEAAPVADSAGSGSLAPAVPPTMAPALRPSTARKSVRSATKKAPARPRRTAAVPDVDDLMPLGWTIAADHEARGITLTRDRLRDAIRGTGQTISTDRAGALLARLRTEPPMIPAPAPDPVPVPDHA